VRRRRRGETINRSEKSRRWGWREGGRGGEKGKSFMVYNGVRCFGVGRFWGT
jgi:hypothetical protein